ncbi:hypothetical protein BGX34_003026 [Mortierella sp. NVP85]|nr:hypothetical protein BGX34_003026 [Mortierella sp. NVP85]
MNLVHSFLLLFSVAAILVQAQEYYIVTSKAIFTGIDRSDPNATPVNIFHDPKNHATAVASILQKFANDANFKPKEHGFLETYDQHYMFINRTNHDDIFEPQPVWDPRPTVSVDGLEDLKAAVRLVYAPVSVTAAEAADAFAELIPKYVDPSMSARVARLVLIVIHSGDNNEITVGLYNIDLIFRPEADGKVILERQYTSVDQKIYKASSQKLIDRAAFYANAYPKVNMKSLVSGFTTFN